MISRPGLCAERPRVFASTKMRQMVFTASPKTAWERGQSLAVFGLALSGSGVVPLEVKMTV
jgi:hypothetical protein